MITDNTPTYLFHSHVEQIREIVRDLDRAAWRQHKYDPVEGSYGLSRVTIDTIVALANVRLAITEQEDDVYLDAPRSDLWLAMHRAGACRDGLSTVGRMCTEESLYRIFEVRDDWRDWYEGEFLRGDYYNDDDDDYEELDDE